MNASLPDHRVANPGTDHPVAAPVDAMPAGARPKSRLTSAKNWLAVFALGILFGVTLTQSQAISWYRIHEMFRFGSFHMYGIIGSALAVGFVITRLIRFKKLKDVHGYPIRLVDKAPGWKRYLFGGLLFGLGWALAGACPGPIFVLIGNGLTNASVLLLSALLGTFSYGLIRHHLPH